MRDRRYRREIGVKIPEDVHPQNWSLYTVCVPDDIEWSIAFRNAVRMMARGRYWKRDERERSIKDAQIIGGEIEMSIGKCDMTEISDAIKYLGDKMAEMQMVQNNQNNCDCCGGAGGGSGDFFDVPEEFEDPNGQPNDGSDMFPPEPSGDDSNLTDAQKCNLAQYFADKWVETYIDIEQIWAGVSVTVNTAYNFLVEKFPPGAILPFVAVVMSSLVVAIEYALLAGVLDRCTDAAQSYRDKIVCAISTAKSANEAKANCLAVLSEVRQVYGKSPYAVMYLGIQMVDFNKMLGGDVSVPPSYDGSVCDCLTEEEDNGAFTAVDGYKWIRVPMQPAAATACDVDGSPLSSSGNENGMQIDRIIANGGLSVFGWDGLYLPDNCAGIGFEFGSVSYVGTGEQNYGFYGHDLDDEGCIAAYGLQIATSSKIFLERKDVPSLDNVGQLVVDLYGFDNYATMHYSEWDSVAIYRNTAQGHENHVQITSIRYLVKDDA
jgi:hypothetical protein